MTTLTQPFKRRLPKIDLYGEVKLNIGCGNKNDDGFIGIDIRECGQDLMWDVREGIPFPDESIDLIWSSHVIEHFNDAECEDLFREFYRILKPGGKTYHALPHVEDPTAYYFDHKTFWNEERVTSLTGVPGLEVFKIIKNEMNTESTMRGKPMKQLIFGLQK